MGETREGKETQRGHIFNIKFKLPIVKDSIKYKNDKKKSDGYSLKDGKKSTRTEEQMVYKGNISKKKLTKSMFHTKSFHGGGLNSEVHQIPDVIPCLEFSIEFQSNKLIYQKEYT